MESVIFKQLLILTLILAIPSAVLLQYLYNQPVIPIAFILGISLGIIRLKALFDYLICILDTAKEGSSKILMFKYIVSIIISLFVLCYMLYKSQKIGIYILLGLIAVPIIIMIYALWQGLILYKKS